MITLLVSFILIFCFFLLYLINPRDIFRIEQLKEARSKSMYLNIDRDFDAEKIIKILDESSIVFDTKDTLSLKFSKCNQHLQNNKSSFYRFFGNSSIIIANSLKHSKKSQISDELMNELYYQLKKFIKALENKDKKVCYESIASFVYLTSIREIPKPDSRKIEELNKRIWKSIDNYRDLIPLEMDLLQGIDQYLYIFIRNFDSLYNHLYEYSNINGADENVEKNAELIMKDLYEEFLYYYDTKNISGQCEIVKSLSNEPGNILQLDIQVLECELK